ncbi:MAG TPA: ABC transporter permease, partial [Candidatus Eisenbacteria bacterium]|nr:ABC transporter permease [Candidatus Eisenbacteria bacterium]
MFEFKPSRMFAVAERDLRRFRRNSAFLVPMVLMPITYLVILGKVMGGDLHDLPVAIVDQDRGASAVVVRDRLRTLEQSRELFRLSDELDPSTAVAKLRQGHYRAVVILPPEFSADVSKGTPGSLGIVVDNTDNTTANVIEAELRRAFAGSPGAGGAAIGAVPGIQVERVDVYGHRDFMQYLVPGVIALSLFFVAMLAGGIILVDDRARGIHEGYFVTPLSALDVIGGLTLSAITLSMIIGTVVLSSSILIARLHLLGGFRTIALSGAALFLLALGLILFVFTLMARVSNPLMPRALFGILNVVTFFPSGALYPTESYPRWLGALSAIFPMRYAVNALRNLLLKGVGLQAVLPDFAAMAIFAIVMLVL